jgi:hypothetical protein
MAIQLREPGRLGDPSSAKDIVTGGARSAKVKFSFTRS